MRKGGSGGKSNSAEMLKAAPVTLTVNFWKKMGYFLQTGHYPTASQHI